MKGSARGKRPPAELVLDPEAICVHSHDGLTFDRNSPRRTWHWADCLSDRSEQAGLAGPIASVKGADDGFELQRHASQGRRPTNRDAKNVEAITSEHIRTLGDESVSRSSDDLNATWDNTGVRSLP